MKKRNKLFQFILKTLYEILFLPLTLFLVKTIKKTEESDAIDTDIDYGIFKL